jgi:mediator of RNA polymerase II transcription subunit 17
LIISSFAQFAASNALDLVALTLSKEPARVIENSFSAMFKAQGIPRGSFGVNRVTEAGRRDHEVEIQDYNKKRCELAAKGSRMLALDQVTDDLLRAATQLETEVRKEVNYWEEIRSISRKGWSLQRFRKDQRHSPFAVRYGLPEASDHFKARGLAPLRMDRNGSIILDPALALQPKTIRVRISDNGKITGTSHLSTRDGDAALGIEQSIQLARESLFEEEIYHEISMETRQLLAYGVELRNSVVSLDLASTNQATTQRKILIDCIPRDEYHPESENLSQNFLAQNIAEGLRLLLAHKHRMRLYHRSQIPPPLAQHKHLKPNPLLLHALLAMFSHLHAVNSIQRYLDRTAKLLQSVGLSTELQTSRETTWDELTDKVRKVQRTDVLAMDQVLEAFMKPFNGLASLSLPSLNGTNSEKITIATRTYMGPPTYGAEYKVTLPPSLAAVPRSAQDQTRDFKFPSAEEAISYVDWLLSLDLSHSLLVKEFGSKAQVRGRDPGVTITIKDGRKVVHKDVAVELANGQLTVKVAFAPLIGNTASARDYTWSGTSDGPSFLEKVKEFVG